MHFSEITKLQFGKKKRHTLLCILGLFRIIVALLSLKNMWLPPIFFLDSNSLYKDLLFPHSHKLRKNTSVLVGRSSILYGSKAGSSQSLLISKHRENNTHGFFLHIFLCMCQYIVEYSAKQAQHILTEVE